MILDTQTLTQSLSSEDLLAIGQLNSRYFFAIDALLPGNNAEIWANTFTNSGTFSLLDADQKIIVQATGTQELIQTYKTFPDVEITRHWINHLLIEPDPEGATAGCYVIAMSIKNLPATMIRSGIYQDRLVKVNENWRFQSRILTLDRNSSAG